MPRFRPGFEEFVESHADGLLRTAFLITADRQEAEDVVQECLLQISKRWARVAAMERPLAYTRRVLINVAVRGSGPRVRRQAELDAELVEPSDDFDEFELVATRDELRMALGQITVRQRAVLVLRYFNDLPEAEVAAILGCTVGTVKSTTSRSLQQLRQLIESEPVRVRSDEG